LAKANNHPAVRRNQPKGTHAETTKASETVGVAAETTENNTAGAGATETKSEKRLADGVDTLNKRILDFLKVRILYSPGTVLTHLSKDLNSLPRRWTPSSTVMIVKPRALSRPVGRPSTAVRRQSDCHPW